MNAHMADWAIGYMRHVLGVKGWTAAELARRTGVSHSTINRPLTVEDWPHAISRKTLAKIAEVSGVDPTPFAGRETIGGPIATVSHADEPDLVPVYNVAASAGYGAILDEAEEIVDRLSFPPGYLRSITKSNPANLAIIGVKGESMSPTLSDNDVVMIDRSKTDLSFDGLFVLRDGGASLLVKRVGRGSRRGTVVLISDNRTYPPTERDVQDIEVVGKVVWMGVRV